MSVGDFGPIYAETILGRFPVEPWNTCSNVVFLITAIYFARKTRLDRQRHPLIVTGLPILLLGFVGGTLYHATRSSSIWLLMDFLPIALLAAFAAIYYWLLVVPNRALATLAFVGTSFPGFLLRRVFEFPRPVAISMAYASLAFGILLPVILHCRRSGWKHFSLIATSIASFTVAITFRVLDRSLTDYFPMGTHFLWHLFGALSSFLLLLYTFRVDISRNQGVSDGVGG